MNFLLRFSLLFIFYSFIITIISIDFVKPNDVIELIGYNNRQSKMQKYPIYDNNNNNNNNQHQTSTYITQPMKKQRADIETVKQNIDEYNKLLKIDTKKLSLQQKDMLERIVERVARLKETLDINDGIIKQSTLITSTIDNTTPIIITAKPSTSLFSSSTLNDNNEQSTDSININNDDINNNDDIINSSIKYITDETTYLPPQTTDNIYITTTQQTTLSGGRSALTTTYQQSEEARANLNNLNKNNINLSTISSNSRSSSISSVTGGINKSKIRHSTTKKPMSSSSTKPTSKRIISTSSSSNNNNGHHSRPSMKPTFSTNSPVIVPAVISLTTTTQQSNIGEFSTTILPLQNKQTNYIKQDIISTTDHNNNNNDDVDIDEKTVSSIIIDHHLPPPAVQIQERTPIGGNGGIISSDLIYDSNVTATSIIDSLSNHAREDYYNNNKGSLADNIKDKKPSGGTAKPTKYHYYPHNQHIYLLPECAIQQVCNAVYVRLNYTQPLCACPSRYRDPCSASLNEDDQHTTKLVGDGKKKAITLAKTCEATTEMRECRSPKDWSLLALQNTRTGKSHYLVICRCPDHFKLEGPMAHDQPTYASVPGIRVFGMMCVKPGYSIRKPSVQPPKRYQLQKPYYISNSQHNKYNLNKDNQRPSSLSSLNLQSSNNGYQQQQQLPSNGGYQNNNQQHDSYQLQNQANYQYLNRPESSPIITSVSHTEYPDTIGINSFSTNSVSISSANSGYGRNNEKNNGENPIEADEENVDDDNTNSNNDNNDNDEKKRTKRSTKIHNIDNNIPEFPWDKLVEFQQSVVWDE